ncbi:MAG: hypothetical protein U0802_12635 [Candidatus Binatia bacterium]
MTNTNWRTVAAGMALLAPLAAPAWGRDGQGGGARCAPTTVAERIASTGLDPDGSAAARWRQDERCRRDFEVEVQDVPAGAYDLVVGGVRRGAIAVAVDPVTGRSRGQIEFEDPGDDAPHAPELDFDPLGAPLEIRAAAGIYFADTFDGVSGAATPAPTRTAVPTRVEDAGTPTRAATRTRTPRPAVTATAPRAPRTATPPRTSRSATGWLSWLGWDHR